MIINKVCGSLINRCVSLVNSCPLRVLVFLVTIVVLDINFRTYRVDPIAQGYRSTLSKLGAIDVSDKAFLQRFGIEIDGIKVEREETSHDKYPSDDTYNPSEENEDREQRSISRSSRAEQIGVRQSIWGLRENPNRNLFRYSSGVGISYVACQPPGWTQVLASCKTLVAQLRAEHRCSASISGSGISSDSDHSDSGNNAMDHLPIPVFIVLDLFDNGGGLTEGNGVLSDVQGRKFLEELWKIQNRAKHLVRVQLLDVGILARIGVDRLHQDHSLSFNGEQSSTHSSTPKNRTLSSLFTKEFKQCASIRLLLPDLLPVPHLIHLDADVIVADRFVNELVQKSAGLSLSSTSGISSEGSRLNVGVDTAFFMAEEIATNLKIGWYHEHSFEKQGDLKEEVMAGRTGYNSGVLVVNVQKWRESGVGLLHSKQPSPSSSPSPPLSLWNALDAAHASNHWFFHLGDQDLLNWIGKRRPNILGNLGCEFNLRSDSRCSNSTIPNGVMGELQFEKRRAEIVKPALVHANRGLMLDVVGEILSSDGVRMGEKGTKNDEEKTEQDEKSEQEKTEKEQDKKKPRPWPDPDSRLGKRWQDALRGLVQIAERGTMSGGEGICSLWELAGLGDMDLSPYKLKGLV